MIPPTLKSLLLLVINTIDEKLKTRTGRLTLLIIGNIIVGGTSVHSYNMQEKSKTLEKEKDKLETDKTTLQLALNTHIKNADRECNEKVKEAAILQQQLRDIYDNRAKENNTYIQEQEKIVKQKEKLLSIQAPIINTLKKLNK